MSSSLRTQPRRIRALRRIATAPRVRVSRPPPDYVHPVTRSDITSLLQRLGPEHTYGLSTVHLAAPPRTEDGKLLFGRLIVPGVIVLYAQPVPPWALPARLAARDEEALRLAGAQVTIAGNGTQTIVDWPGATLRRFMLLDVLLHELGHHRLQHERRAPAGRVVRERDHEAFAEQFARRCRRRLELDTAGG
jgi:hypothetical protein